jgi:hypothetical protein
MYAGISMTPNSTTRLRACPMLLILSIKHRFTSSRQHTTPVKIQPVFRSE